jgi:hypothetical protein
MVIQKDEPLSLMLIRALVFLVAAAPLMAQDTANVAQQAAPTNGASPRVTAGVTTGSMDFADRRVQQAVTGVVRYRIVSAVSISASPTFARVAYPSTLGGGSVSGLTDLPVELSGDRAFDMPWSPTPGFSLGVSLPIGDQQVGFGTGGVGATAAVGLGFSPLDAFSAHVGIGRSLNGYTLNSTLGGASDTWGDLEASYQLLNRLEATVGLDGDVTASDSLGASRIVALSFATNVGGPYTVTVSGGHGVSGPAARWTFALGFGTDFAGIQSLGSSSPIQRFMRSLGGGRTHSGLGSTNGSGHGRAP